MKAFIIDRYDSSFARKEMLKTEELVSAAGIDENRECPIL